MVAMHRTAAIKETLKKEKKKVEKQETKLQ